MSLLSKALAAADVLRAAREAAVDAEKQRIEQIDAARRQLNNYLRDSLQEIRSRNLGFSFGDGKLFFRSELIAAISIRVKSDSVVIVLDNVECNIAAFEDALAPKLAPFLV